MISCILGNYSGVPGRRCAVGPRKSEEHTAEPVATPVKIYKLSPEEMVELEKRLKKCQKEKVSSLVAFGDFTIEEHRNKRRKGTRDVK